MNYNRDMAPRLMANFPEELQGSPTLEDAIWWYRRGPSATAYARMLDATRDADVFTVVEIPERALTSLNANDVKFQFENVTLPIDYKDATFLAISVATVPQRTDNLVRYSEALRFHGVTSPGNRIVLCNTKLDQLCAQMRASAGEEQAPDSLIVDLEENEQLIFLAVDEITLWQDFKCSFTRPPSERIILSGFRGPQSLTITTPDDMARQKYAEVCLAACDTPEIKKIFSFGTTDYRKVEHPLELIALEYVEGTSEAMREKIANGLGRYLLDLDDSNRTEIVGILDARTLQRDLRADSVAEEWFNRDVSRLPTVKTTGHLADYTSVNAIAKSTPDSDATISM